MTTRCARALNDEVGVEHVELLGEVSATLTRRYAAAVGERDPLYHDAAYAQEPGLRQHRRAAEFSARRDQLERGCALRPAA